MSQSENKVCPLMSGRLIDYSLLEIIHHIMGNGLAAVSEYTQLLERALLAQTQEEHLQLERGKQEINKWLRYLQAMRIQETQLGEFLAQLRESPITSVEEKFSRDFVKTDLLLVLAQVIEHLVPFHKDRVVQTHLPEQPLYILCDLAWLKLALEHLMSYMIAAHTSSTPVGIWGSLEEDQAGTLHEVKICIRARRSASAQKSSLEGMFAIEPHTIHGRECELCIAMCNKIIKEHGGCIWFEQGAEQEEMATIVLPLVIQPT
ncbi:hypothetical protein KSD_87300 [Ktedonobacter sp. SOSP1-85]|uniref:HAMP domain-containing histidine kinase n=1 Tax=Ktedonobacter sp. SOSP1-85 TaxID=2778367 RepID=UPI001916968B|nr:HAMP domain-containing histidine kinase [Ktedonobacter sp. SOSP1-85]GHO80959.1 hypothetical protein KSD_87300 [Ktedonobacter sp. SOSP1-85]